MPWIALRAKGFTLLEVIVVMLIVALLSSVFLLPFHARLNNERMDTFTKKLALQFKVAQTQAVLTNQVLAWQIRANTSQFMQYQAQAKKPWQVITQRKALASRPIPAKLMLSVAPLNRHQPTVIFYPNATLSDASIWITNPSNQMRYQILLQKEGRIHILSQGEGQ